LIDRECRNGLEVIEMMRVSAEDLQRQWDRVQDIALAEPVTVTCNGRDRMVLLSVEEYSRLKRRDRQVMTPADFTAEDLEVLEKTKAPGETAAFNREVTE
jgi:PHD/YefM family antitoxin component YafN of YafNO toxin-antitoxin module